MSTNNYVPGQWAVICDVCGVKYKSSQLRKRWDGFWVCNADWEPRHPADFLKVKSEGSPPPWTRPEATDVFVEVDYVASTVGEQETSVPSGTYSPEEPSL